MTKVVNDTQSVLIIAACIYLSKINKYVKYVESQQ